MLGLGPKVKLLARNSIRSWVAPTWHRSMFFSFMFLVFLGCAAGWWPLSSAGSGVSSASTSQTMMEEGKTRKLPAKFEVSTADDKFMAAAQRYLDSIPPLEQCQHSVISQLKSSCGQMSDEDLGKVSVLLFNCQSEAEGRPVYLCTDEMTLAECTGPMDATTWNAYHIFSNRARSVCYFIQQQRFKMQTEVAVNQLSESTLQQLLAVQDLADRHKEMQDLTQNSLQHFQHHQELLLMEKITIQNGQELLGTMMKTIREELEDASFLLEKQEEKRQEMDERVVGNLQEMRENIMEVKQGVDDSKLELLDLMTEAKNQYRQTLQDLQAIDSSVTSVKNKGDSLQHKLDWVVELLGGTRDQLHLPATLVVHVAYLVLTMLCLVFVCAPAAARVALLVLVVGNVVAEVNFHSSLSLGNLASLQVVFLLGNWWYVWFRGFQTRSLSEVATNSCQTLSNQPSRHLQNSPRPVMPVLSGGSPSPKIDPTAKCIPMSKSISAVFTSQPSPPVPDFVPKSASYSVPLVVSTLPTDLRCRAQTKAGHRCKLAVSTPHGNLYCKRHQSHYDTNTCNYY